jgi:UDPglucose 6-dehydrogenase
MDDISIIGSGQIGIAVGLGFEQLGKKVIFYDIDENRIEQLKELGHMTTSDLKHAINDSSVTFVCVPTPSHDSIDLSHVISAVTGIAGAIREKSVYHLVVIKSTVLPTTTERTVIPLLANSGKKLGEEFGLCVNPEFLTESAVTWTDDKCYQRDFFTEDRIVIGEYDSKSGDILEQLYKPLEGPIFRTDMRTAEMIKYAANCMLATKISFWNEIFLICQKLGINSQQVADIVTLDLRIGKYGSVHGKAFGGKCLPKDLKAFVSFAQEFHNPALLAAAEQINDYMAANYGVRE